MAHRQQQVSASILDAGLNAASERQHARGDRLAGHDDVEPEHVGNLVGAARRVVDLGHLAALLEVGHERLDPRRVGAAGQFDSQAGAVAVELRQELHAAIAEPQAADRLERSLARDQSGARLPRGAAGPAFGGRWLLRAGERARGHHARAVGGQIDVDPDEFAAGAGRQGEQEQRKDRSVSHRVVGMWAAG